jgi:ankyrin repeat protein
MGSGASKKKGATGQDDAATSVDARANVESAAATLAAAAAVKASEEPAASPAASPVIEKPKAAAEVKRPQRKKGSKGNTSSGDEPSASPSPSPEWASQQAAASSSLPMPPRLPGNGDSPVKAKMAEDSSGDDEAVGRQGYPAQEAPKAAAPAPTAQTSPKAQQQQLPPSPKNPPPEMKPEELAAACRQGDNAAVEAFLISNARTAKGLSEMSEALFDAYGDSVLHHAVHGGSLKVVQSLLELGRVQVDIPNARNETALQIACRRGHADIVAHLLEANADPDRRDGQGLTPFLSAVFAGGGEATLELLTQARANVAVQDERGISALHFAAIRGDSSLILWLLQHEASADMQTEHGTTPLMLAARRGHAESVTAFLEGKVNTMLTDEAGCTALMHALSASHTEAATQILASTPTVESVDCAGRSALFHAVLGGRIDGVVAVIQRGGRVNILDEEGRSPLYQACLMGEQSLVQCLLDADADPNLAGRGTTVRPAASMQGEEEENEKESDAARACLEESRTCLQVAARMPLACRPQ